MAFSLGSKIPCSSLKSPESQLCCLHSLYHLVFPTTPQHVPLSTTHNSLQLLYVNVPISSRFLQHPFQRPKNHKIRFLTVTQFLDTKFFLRYLNIWSKVDRTFGERLGIVTFVEKCISLGVWVSKLWDLKKLMSFSICLSLLVYESRCELFAIPYPMPLLPHHGP